MTLSPLRQLIAISALLLVAVLWAWYVENYHWPMLNGVDNYAYWSAWQDGSLYAPGARLAQATYIYSPAFAQLLYPFTLLPWDYFRMLWIAASWVAMAYLLWPLTGALRWAAIILACYFCLGANADWVVALCLGLGLRYPATWAGLLLTKVTPGIGVVWFAVRREWRNLAIALGTTAGIVLVSAAITPQLWFDWLDALMRSLPYSAHGSFFGLEVPSLLWRLPAALVLVIVGAVRGWPWVLPASALIAQADIWGVTVVFFASLPRLYESVGDRSQSGSRSSNPADRIAPIGSTSHSTAAASDEGN